MVDPRDVFIGKAVRGRTFADVGGLWGTVNEKVSVAHKQGATELAMIDVTTEGGDLWHAFDERMRTQRIAGYRKVVADVCLVEGLAFDVVHCSGVLYHHPNPQQLLGALRRMTREHLVLSSAITQEVVENEHGTYRIPPSGVLFVPALNDKERAILAAYWRAVGADVHGITVPVKYRATDFGPWWWLPTAESMVAMASAAGFEVLDRASIWGGNAHTLLCRPC